MEEKTVLKKNPNMVSRQIDKERVILPIFKTSDEMNYIYTLNKAASAVWDMIDSKNTVRDIKKEMLKKFDITPKEAAKKIEEVLKDLKEIEAIL